MATTGKSAVNKISVSCNPQKQTLDQVNKMVALALGRAGCERCGRLAYLDLQFLGDPGPDFSKVGAISVNVQER